MHARVPVHNWPQNSTPQEIGMKPSVVLKSWCSLLFLLFVAAGAVLLSSSASAAIEPPPDPEQGLAYPPADGFIWWMAPRFGQDVDQDGIVDYRYDPNWVRATGFLVHFNGCLTADERQKSPSATTTYLYRFTIDNVSDNGFQRHCKVGKTLAQGAHVVVLEIQDSQGASKGRFEQTVNVKDRLIVSIGDSYGSGEGNPDIPREWKIVNGEPVVAREARWVDRRCHRSATAGPAQAAIELEYADHHSSVTFFSLACSGATISTADPDTPSNGSGLLGPYTGAEPGDNPNPPMLPPQVDELKRIIADTTVSDLPPRPIDDLVISIGGNDIQFVKLIMDCTLSIDCYNIQHIRERLSNRRGELPDKYDDLARALKAIPINNTYITEYPNLTLQDNGQFCGTNSTWWNEPLMMEVTQPEVKWLYENLLFPMNRQIMPERAAVHGWTFVGYESRQVV